MKYYERCKLTVDIPTTGDFNELTVCKALADALPGIEIEFRAVSSCELPTAAEAYVPQDHPVAGAEAQDFATKKWTSVGGRSILLTAGDILCELNERNA